MLLLPCYLVPDPEVITLKYPNSTMSLKYRGIINGLMLDSQILTDQGKEQLRFTQFKERQES